MKVSVPTQWNAWSRATAVSASMPMRSMLSTRCSNSVITSRLVPYAALGHGVEVVQVAAAAAGEGVFAEPALEPVVVIVALEVSPALEPMAPSMLVSLSVSLPRLAVSLVRLRSTTTVLLRRRTRNRCRCRR